MTTTSPQRENENTRQYVTRLMEEAVALKGEDYVYEQRKPDDFGETCDYIRDGQPSCIVGHVLVAAGVRPEVLSNHEGEGAYSAINTLAHCGGQEGLIEWAADNDLRSALNDAQGAQDAGRTWGEALGAYKSMLGVE